MLDEVAVAAAAARSYMVYCEEASIDNDYLMAVDEDVSYVTEEEEHDFHNLDHTLSNGYLHKKGLGRP